MSASGQFVNGSNSSKKAVHVKWAGKTIALGTFGVAEADEKCARAKALTRAWRSTMRPKPSREWVMVELERLGVRVVSGRLGRKSGEDDDDEPGMGGGGGGGVGKTGGMMERNNSMGWGGDADLNTLMARRNSSLGLSMMTDRRGSLSSLGQVAGLENDLGMQPHRPLVGGGAAAAYEAARHDHLLQKSNEQKRRASSLGLGNLTSGGLGMGMVNPNQHYEMLKLHHMNLLNEIQETTLMMNLYQQQQLQQQQQQLQQEASGMGDGMGGMMSMSNDVMFGNQLSQSQRASLSLGTMGGGGGFNQLQMMQQMNGMAGGNMGGGNGGGGGGGVGSGDGGGGDMESRLAQLKEDINRGQKAEVVGSKREAGGEDAANAEPPAKRAKTESKENEDGNDDNATGESADV